MNIVSIEVQPDLAPGEWVGAIDLLVRPSGEPLSRRCRLYYVDETGTARREHGGPILPGPYAYLVVQFGADRSAPAKRLNPYDVIEVKGHLFELVDDDDLRLEPVQVRELAARTA